jgi:LysM repeat protein
MARYRGRHRAPSTTGRTIARTAIAGAVAGAPLLIAAPAAHAAASGTWDKVAQCESGGRWNVNTGNGYHGGLQFAPSTWKGFGGGEFAASAHQATRAQQIVVAERVLAAQGWGAWPVCSRKAGARGEPATQRSAPEVTEIRASTPAKSAVPKSAAPKDAGAKSTSGGYVVKRGDTLSTIASRNGVSGGWKALVKKNPGLTSPDSISVGQSIAL